MPESDSEVEAVCIVHNIPKSFRARDVRSFFSQMVEAGVFKCFHYRHRPEIQQTMPSGSDAQRTKGDDIDTKIQENGENIVPLDTLADDFLNISGSARRSNSQVSSDSLLAPPPTGRISVSRRGPHPACCAPLKLRSRSSLRQLLKLYDKKHWVDGSGTYLARRCFISEVRIAAEEKCHLAKMIEFQPPAAMPQGNVGTPTRHFLEEIQRCRLPATIVKRLGLVFPRQAKRRQYSAVAMDYGTGTMPKTSEQEAHLAKTAGGIELVDELPSRKVAAVGQTEVVRALPPRASDETGAEETDRHEALHDDVTSQERTKERLYEEEMEIIWEKGGPGLVWYTDAVFWDQQKGDFDERTADDWDVDMSAYEKGGNPPDMDTQMSCDMRRERRLRDGLDSESVFRKRPSKTISKNEESDSDEEPQVPVGAFSRHTRGFGRRILINLGWSEGKGLGATCEGISHPIPAQGQRDRSGLGFAGEPLPSWGASSRKRSRRDVEGVVITTAFDTPGDDEVQESVNISALPTFMKFRKSNAAS